MNYSHQPVLLDEVIHYLNPRPGGKYVDGTLGGGGHTLKIIERIFPDGQVLAIDLDPTAIAAASKRVKNKKQVIFVKDNFKNIKQISNVQRFNQINGILLDLGLSSGQLQDQHRGFSFLAEGRLDMRFGAQTDVTAEKIVNEYTENELYEIFKNFGEEKLARPISKKIIETRQLAPITKPEQIVDIVSQVYKKYFKEKSKVNPATKVFQALRIAVNEEMENLDQVLPDAVSLLKPGGRLAIISYHSLEDRKVKQFFKDQSTDYVDPQMPELPVSGPEKKLKIITKKPVVPTEAEIASNPRARSAKLRVAEKI